MTNAYPLTRPSTMPRHGSQESGPRIDDIAKLLIHPTAIVGTTGAGKTFAAKGAVEMLIREGRRVIILDPTGAWWGLRSGAEGNGSGLPVMIFGGEHADVPIDPNSDSGKALAAALAPRDVQAIIDISEMTGGEKNRFLTPFLETLYAKNKAALHLVVDEADEIAAQRIAEGEQRLFGIFDKIVRRGRIKGFRPLMITQRPAVIHKNVLSQIGTLIAMKLTSPQDRKAIDDWVKGNADSDQAKAVMSSLPTLARGEGWVWSPADGVLDRVNFPPITTFDSSRTPEAGEVITAPQLAPVDVKALRGALAATDDVGDPDRRSDPDEVKRAFEKGFRAGYEKGSKEGCNEGRWKGYHGQLVKVVEAIASAANIVGDGEALVAAVARMKAIEPPDRQGTGDELPTKTEAQTASVQSVARPIATEMTPSARKIVEAVISVYPRGISLKVAAKRAGLSIRSSAYKRHMAMAATSSDITERSDGKYVAADPPDEFHTAPGIDAFKSRLPPSQARMLEVIHAAAGKAVSRDGIAALAEISKTSSGLGSGLRELLSLELIVESDGGFAISSDFLEGPSA